MKRFVETTRWVDPWFRRLPIKHKILWCYIVDSCDNAGVWKIDFDLTSFQVGEYFCEEDLKQFNQSKERVIIHEDLLVVKDFIAFQIGNLRGDKLTNLQKNCLALVLKYRKKKINLTGSLRVRYGYKHKGNKVIKDIKSTKSLDDQQVVNNSKYNNNKEKLKPTSAAQRKKMHHDTKKLLKTIGRKVR